jgi:ribosomal protein S27AE
LVEAGRLVAHTRVLAGVSLAKKGDLVGDRIVPFYCGNCGYIEFYKETKVGERPQERGSLKKCLKCGKQISIASEECQYCGAKQKEGVKR